MLQYTFFSSLSLSIIIKQHWVCDIWHKWWWFSWVLTCVTELFYFLFAIVWMERKQKNWRGKCISKTNTSLMVTIQSDPTRPASQVYGDKKQIDVNFMIYSNWTVYEGKWPSKHSRATCVRTWTNWFWIAIILRSSLNNKSCVAKYFGLH